MLSWVSCGCQLGEAFLFEMENTVAEMYNTTKQDSAAQQCGLVAAAVAFQVLLNYKMKCFPLKFPVSSSPC